MQTEMTLISVHVAVSTAEMTVHRLADCNTNDSRRNPLIGFYSLHDYVINLGRSYDSRMAADGRGTQIELLGVYSTTWF